MNETTVEKIEAMCNALGIIRIKFRKGQKYHTCYKNYFVISEPDELYELWEDIVADGCADKLTKKENIIYSVNKKGMILLSRIYGINFTEDAYTLKGEHIYGH